MSDLWTRIRKARLFQVLAVYAAVSWVILQVADVLEDTLELPSWVAAATLLVLLAGLVVVLATAWLQAHPPAPPEADGVVTRGEVVVHRWVLPQFTWRRAIAGGAAALVILALVVLGVMRDGDGVLGADEARADVAGVGLAVLPFHVSGPNAELWREGMVDLLATNLDGVAGLRTIDPATVLARLPEQDAPLEKQLEVAEDVRARYALIGSAVGLVSNVRLTAEIHDLTTGRVVARARAEGPQEAVLRLVDELSVDLVGQLMRSEGDETGLRNTESMTTSSLEALRAYLEAEQLYRSGDIAGASTAYERAVRADSTFALAWWGLAWARGWLAGAEMQDLSDDAFEHVVALSDRLPERTRMFVRGDSLRRAGDAAAEQVFESAVARYPDDPEAWFMLGEVRFHSPLPWTVGYDEMLQPFRRAVALDPSSGPYYYHLVPGLIALGDTLLADSLTRRFERFTGDSARADGWRLARRILTPPLAFDADAVERTLEGATPEQLQDIVFATILTMSYPPALEGAAAAAMDAGVQAFQGGHVGARIEQGRLREVVDFAGSGQVPDFVVPTILTVVRILGGQVPEPMAERYLTPEFADGHFAYWAGTDAWLRGDVAELRRSIVVLDSLAAATASDTARAETEAWAAQADGLRALQIALVQRNPSTAADSLYAVLVRISKAPTQQSLMAMNSMRNALARLYMVSDRPRDVIALYEPRVPPRPSPLLAYQLAVAYDDLGERDRAMRYYAIFLEGWRNADPGLPFMQEAQRAMARLTGEG